MKKYFVFFLPVLVFANSFFFEPNEPVRGKDFKVSFEPKGMDKKTLVGIFILSKKDTQEVFLLKPVFKEKKALFKLHIPKDAELIEFKFEDDKGNVIDENGVCMVKVVVDTQEKPVFNAYYRWARTYLRFSKYDLSKVKELLETEITLHPENWIAWDLLMQIKLDEDSTLLPHIRYTVDSLLHEAKDSLEMLHFVILNASIGYLRWPELADSILFLCATKYPSSQYWRYQTYVSNLIRYFNAYPKKEKFFEEEIFPMLQGPGKETAYYILFALAAMRMGPERLSLIAKSFALDFPSAKRTPELLVFTAYYLYPSRDSLWLEEMKKIHKKYPDNERVLHQLARYTKDDFNISYEYYKKLISLKRNPEYLNEFAYFLSTHKKYTKEAEKLVKEAIDSLTFSRYRKKMWWLSFKERERERLKDLAFYYDTYMWIKFNAEKLREAKKLLLLTDTLFEKAHYFDKEFFIHMKEIGEKLEEPELEKKALLGILLAEKDNKEAYKRLQEIYEEEHGTRVGFESWFLESTRKLLLRYRLNEPAFLFKAEDMDGNTIELYRLRGKIVVINFWATWCGPCKREIPDLNRLVEKFKEDTSVVFLAITDEPKKKIKDFLKETPFFYQIIPNAKEVLRKYLVKSIPMHLIIDKNGYIQFMHVGAIPGIEVILEEEIKALK